MIPRLNFPDNWRESRARLLQRDGKGRFQGRRKIRGNIREDVCDKGLTGGEGRGANSGRCRDKFVINVNVARVKLQPL